MAKRYVTTNNSRGNAVTASNPTFAHIRGWNAGVMIQVDASDKSGNTWRVYATGGSNSAAQTLFLGTVTTSENGPVFEPSGDEMSSDAYNSATDSESE